MQKDKNRVVRRAMCWTSRYVRLHPDRPYSGNQYSAGHKYCLRLFCKYYWSNPGLPEECSEYYILREQLILYRFFDAVSTVDPV